MTIQQDATRVDAPTFPAGQWLHYWSLEKQEIWKAHPADKLDQLQQSHRPRYITILATTVTDDPASKKDGQYLGPLVIDLDRKDEQGGKAAAIQDIQRIAKRLEGVGVNLDQVQWFASGQKGFHIVLPTALFKIGEFSEPERRHLPAIYKEMVFSSTLLTDGNDMSLYSAGKGKMLRQANVRRENGRFKVPITSAEVMSMTPVIYDQLTSRAREIELPHAASFCPGLGILFANAAKEVVQRAARRPKVANLTAEEINNLPAKKRVIAIVKREALLRICNLLEQWLPGGEWQGDHYVARNPKRNDRHPGSFMIWADGGFRDWACPDDCSGGDLVALYAYLKGYGVQMEDAARKLAEDLKLDLDTEIARPGSKVAAAAKAAAKDTFSEAPVTAPKSPARAVPTLMTLQQLIAKEFPPVKWVVQDLLPVGVTLFAAAPKTGKSWLALDIAICVAAGVATLGGKTTTQGRVLYLALEDNERRLKDRATAVMHSRRVTPEAFDCHTEWETIDRGGATRIESWLTDNPNASLVVVDTLARIKPEIRANKDRYAQEYAAMSELKALSDRFEVAILVITHTRKQASDDPMDAISGSLGLSGGVDNTWVMRKPRGEHQAALFVIGRDIVDEINYGLKWDTSRCVWSIEGNAAEMMANSARQDVISVLRKSALPLSVEDIALDVGKDRSSTQRLLSALVDSNLVVRKKVGKSFLYSRP